MDELGTLDEAPLERARPAGIKLIAMSSDGTFLATADVNRRVRVWAFGELVFETDMTHTHDKFRALDSVYSLAFSPTGEVLFVTSGETFWVFESRSGREFWSHASPPTFGFLITTPVGMSVSSGGAIAVSNTDGNTDVWQFDSMGLYRLARWYDNEGPGMISWLRDDQRVVGSDHQAICIWEARTGVKLSRFVPGERVHGLAASRIHDVMAFRTLHKVFLYDTEGAMISSADVAPGLPTLAFSPTAELLAFSDSKGISVCDYALQEQHRLEVPGGIPISLAMHPDGSSLIAGFGDGRMVTFSLNEASATQSTPVDQA
jgi:WD40 repeat protein